LNIEWDEKKNRINIAKHGISFELAAHVFTDPLRKEYYNAGHSSNEEDRIITVGIVENRMLFVSFTEPESDTVHIISARKVSKKERMYYYGDR
jgi:uncharacterized DUF497 family protein